MSQEENAQERDGTDTEYSIEREEHDVSFGRDEGDNGKRSDNGETKEKCLVLKVKVTT